MIYSFPKASQNVHNTYTCIPSPQAIESFVLFEQKTYHTNKVKLRPLVCLWQQHQPSGSKFNEHQDALRQ